MAKNAIKIDFTQGAKFVERFKIFTAKDLSTFAADTLNRLAKATRFDFMPETWGAAVTVRKKSFLKSRSSFVLVKKNERLQNMQSAAGIMDGKKEAQTFSTLEEGGRDERNWMVVGSRVGERQEAKVSSAYRKYLKENQRRWTVLHRTPRQTIMATANGAIIKITGTGKKRGKGAKRKRGTGTGKPKRLPNFTVLRTTGNAKSVKPRKFILKAGQMAVNKRLAAIVRLAGNKYLKL